MQQIWHMIVLVVTHPACDAQPKSPTGSPTESEVGMGVLTISAVKANGLKNYIEASR